MWQVICLENSGEVCSHETRLDDFTYLIDIDVIKVILTITAATYRQHSVSRSACLHLGAVYAYLLGNVVAAQNIL